jgi:hypothetical protein
VQNQPGSGDDDFRPSPIFSWGCGSVIASFTAGAIAWYIADSLNPCYCEGDTDAEFYTLLHTAPVGLITFLLTQSLFVVLVVRAHKRNRRR